MGLSMRSPAAADESRTPARRRGRLAGLAGLAGVVAALGAGAPAAQADTWGYEQVTPSDGGAYEPYARGVSSDLSTAYVQTFSIRMAGLPGDGRPENYYYGLRDTAGGWDPFLATPISPENGFSGLGMYFLGWAADGSRSLIRTTTPLNGESFFEQQPKYYSTSRESGDTTDLALSAAPAEASRTYVLSDDGKTLAFQAGTDLYVEVGASAERANVDGDGSPMQLSGIGRMPDANPVSEGGSTVIFASSTALDGDNDGTGVDLYQRNLVDGTTRLLSDDTPGAGADPTGAAAFSWASPDHGRVMWSTIEQRAGDTDNAADLYYRDGDGPIVRISQGETVDGSPTGNADAPTGTVDWVTTSEDGDRVFFVAEERLTQDAPAAAGKKLYERDIAEGVTRFVAGPLTARDASGNQAGSLLLSGETRSRGRGLRATSWGAVFMSSANLAGDVDGDLDIFAWTRGGGLQRINTSQPGASVSPPGDAWLIARTTYPDATRAPAMLAGGRSVGGLADDRVFFTTSESLTADDTDGGRLDVYAWSTDGSVELVSPSGDAQTDATYLQSSPDGTRVFFETAETVLPGDTDGGLVDTYLAVLGGGSAPSKPVPPAPPAGPAGPAGPLPQVPSTPTPASGTPKPVEPVEVDPPLEPVEGDDDNDRPERANLKVRVGKRLGDDGARLAAKASAAGELRIRAVARVRRGDKLRKARVARASEEIGARERTRFDVALSDAALERLEQRGRLRVRFVLRLVPSGDARAAKERVRVTLRSGQRG